MKQQNEIWGRDFQNWFILLLGVINLMLGIQIFPYWISCLNFFTAGMCFSSWLFSDIINSNFRMINSLLKMSRDILDTVDNKIKEKEKQKEVKKK